MKCAENIFLLNLKSARHLRNSLIRNWFLAFFHFLWAQYFSLLFKIWYNVGAVCNRSFFYFVIEITFKELFLPLQYLLLNFTEDWNLIRLSEEKSSSSNSYMLHICPLYCIGQTTHFLKYREMSSLLQVCYWSQAISTNLCGAKGYLQKAGKNIASHISNNVTRKNIGTSQ